MQPWGIYLGIGASAFLLLLNGFTVFFPPKWNVGDFLSAYIGIPVFLAIYGVHRVYHWSEPWVRPVGSVDMYEGLVEVLAAETPRPQRGWVLKKIICLVE